MTEYEKKRSEHDRYYDNKKPRRQEYASIEEYRTALNEWQTEWSMNLPNKPGYYRAQND